MSTITIPKSMRTELVYLYAKAHPELSLRQIGNPFSISKQAVSKILKRAKKDAQDIKI